MTAQAFRITLPAASLALRLLQSRGLLAVRRKSRYVYYHPAPHPSIPFAESLLSVLQTVLAEPKGPDNAFFFLTAFTHPRRLDILRALGRGVRDSNDLRHICKLSAPAFSRHKTKLLRRGIITSPSPGSFQIQTPDNLLAQVLIRATLAIDQDRLTAATD